MRALIFIVLLIPGYLYSQEIYQKPVGVHSAVSSFENINGVKGKGGMRNQMAKGHAFESLKAGETKVLLNVQGAGILQRIWCTISDRSPLILRSLRLRIFWDGMDKPAVDVPFGDFFVAPLRSVSFESSFFSNPEGRSYVCTIPMPFRSGAKVLLTNESNKDLELLFFDIDYIMMPKLPENSLYFHACWNRTQKSPLGQDAVLLPKVEGKGRFLGVSVGVNVNPEYGACWWGEGEVKVWLDGDSKYPSINGTGAEDYIGTGWGEGLFAHQYEGCLVADSAANQYAFYRFHVPDAIYFDKDCRVSMQQMGGYFTVVVKALQKKGVPLIPVSLAGDKGFRVLLEPGKGNELQNADPQDWLNFYRSDDYAATAYFYLDRPVSKLAPLATVRDRCQGIPN